MKRIKTLLCEEEINEINQSNDQLSVRKSERRKKEIEKDDEDGERW